jgi:SAM-dependent methyltransferase
VRVADLILAEPPAVELVDEVPTGEPVVDRAPPARRATAQRGDSEGTHGSAGYPWPIRPADATNGHTGDMSIWYGDHVADESDLRLCGDLAGKRVLELGVGAGPVPASVIAAVAGAKAIVLDPDPTAIARVRAAAEAASTTDPVRVECHEGELADLGWATSASIDLVIAAHTASQADDLPRLLRQVHRVLRPGCAFVIAMHHPVHRMFAGGETTAYGASSPTFGELYLAFERTNFRWDMVHELTDDRARQAIAPTVLVLRARKQGV